MADNVRYSEPAAAGTTRDFAADEIAGVLHQRVKISLGADGSATDLPGDATNGADVDVTRVQAQPGAANMANGQVAASTTAGTLVAARTTRRHVTIRNLDSSISVYVGIATVTAANGMLLKAEESITLETTALIQVIAASGTPTVAYVEVYD